jgi:hypothetical protein
MGRGAKRRRFYVKAIREKDGPSPVTPGRWVVEVEGWDGPPQIGEFLLPQEPAPDDPASTRQTGEE